MVVVNLARAEYDKPIWAGRLREGKEADERDVQAIAILG